MSEYKHVITVEAFGPEGKIYQRHTTEQFYDTSKAQVSNQPNLFGGVADAVKKAMIAHAISDGALEQTPAEAE